MRFSLVSAALLCLATGMAQATHLPVSSCCPMLSNTKVKFEKILDYTVQTEGRCEIAAIAFWTKGGKRICSDPNSAWAKRIILKLEEEKQKQKELREKGQNEEGSASDVTPAASTTSKNAPQKKGRNGRRRQKKRCRGGRKGQRKRA